MQKENKLSDNKKCEFNKPNCQKKAHGMLTKQLNGWKIQSNPICDNCYKYVIERFSG